MSDDQASSKQGAVDPGTGPVPGGSAAGEPPADRNAAVPDTGTGGEQPEGDEWWQDSAMPWRQKPGRSDIACLVWVGVLGVVSMVMLPLRAWLLGSPGRIPLMVALTGSRSGTVSLGALVHTGEYSIVWTIAGQSVHLWWLWPVVVGTIMSCKLDWVYWWAGKLWGRGMIEVWAGRSERAQRRYERMERWAGKLGWLGMVVAYTPIPLPLMPVVFVLSGASGMSLKRFMSLDLVVCFVWLLGFLALGNAVGAPVEAALDIYAKVANYVTIVLVVVVVAWSFTRSAHQIRPMRRG